MTTIIYVVIAFLFGLYCGNAKFRASINDFIKRLAHSQKQKPSENDYEKAIDWKQVSKETLQKKLDELKTK